MGSLVMKRQTFDHGVNVTEQVADQGERPLDLADKGQKSQKPVMEQTVALNDPAINQAWGFKKSEAAKAWEISKGSDRIVVAVIDTGADVDHEDLALNIWKNEGEVGVVQNDYCKGMPETKALSIKECNKSINGIDDDGNGFKDDVHGWNFVSNNGDLTDNHGHGTHIAGIVGAQAGNGKGIAGIAPNVSLMVLKYFDPKVPNTDNLKNTIESIRYAIKMKANIINYSGGGTEFSAEEKAAIQEARNQGILFVAAAGNERSNSDHHKYYPADYGLDNIISVTAIDPKTEVLSSSNYGVETVDLAAPGQNILSTLPGSNYGYMTGTSQATAFVTGAAVLVMAHHTDFSVGQVKKYVLSTGDSNAALIAKTRTSRRLNLYKALTMLDAGVTASGVASASSTQSYTMDAGQGMEPTSKIATFGKSLMDALGGESNAGNRLGETQ
ncbi:MAG: S8 family serine peptidase [Bdellovibrionaceae bacterium]|nr:S8 family serine peptidase [Pseudobdellovibrionaceae bacterium]